ncbi:hypothetical protein LIA77_03673 [Sarocladium implicatum]|nr:hypothetical protein LIA77_03673 [Sarocladium implicatum]
MSGSRTLNHRLRLRGLVGVIPAHTAPDQQQTITVILRISGMAVLGCSVLTVFRSLGEGEDGRWWRCFSGWRRTTGQRCPSAREESARRLGWRVGSQDKACN